LAPKVTREKDELSREDWQWHKPTITYGEIIDCTSTKSKDRKLNVIQISECLEQVECRLQYKNQVQEDDQYLRYVLGRLKTSCNNNYKTHYINNN
jgi:hypothetical protein